MSISCMTRTIFFGCPKSDHAAVNKNFKNFKNLNRQIKKKIQNLLVASIMSHIKFFCKTQKNSKTFYMYSNLDDFEFFEIQNVTVTIIFINAWT